MSAPKGTRDTHRPRGTRRLGKDQNARDGAGAADGDDAQAVVKAPEQTPAEELPGWQITVSALWAHGARGG